MTAARFVATTLALMGYAMAADFYVSPQGVDTNDGTIQRPFKTIARAQMAVRNSADLRKKPITVHLREGKYDLDSPIVFSPEDSGAADAPVTYAAHQDEPVVISGAKMLTLEWQPYRDGILQAKTPADLKMDQLMVNGVTQHMARYPNFDPKELPLNGSAANAFSPERAKNWKDPVGGYIHAIHKGGWGGMHYRITNKNPENVVGYEGGWQNNRNDGINKRFRYVENIFEELDTPGEWFHDAKGAVLYFYPPKDLDLKNATFEASQLKHLFEIYGATEQPVAKMTLKGLGTRMSELVVDTPVTTKPVEHITIKKLRFTGTNRTFMETNEPLLRSDWALYRGGAIHLRGTKNITITQCFFDQLGGNAVFVDGYNRGVRITSNRFDRNGASDVNFVGSPAAVRNPIFAYEPQPPALDTIDTEKGPKSEEYPADCLVEDNLMGYSGRTEKQTSGVNIAMASRITVRHNTIHDVPRAAINVCTGTWGGHVIEWNDCFRTVLETSDHGAFNSWGRDRFWFQAAPLGAANKEGMRKYVQKYPDIMLWDAIETTFLRHNRMHCDHGWDIDLDDGSTNYEIYNNLCLAGGLKTREGFYRKVYNNIIVAGPYTCNVPYEAPVYDSFERNIIVSGMYSPPKPVNWKGVLDYTFFHSPGSKVRPASEVASNTGQDANSLIGDAMFVDPKSGDFSVKPDSPAIAMGFKNFPMTGFGVTSEELKKIAPQPPIRMPQKFYFGGKQTRPVEAKKVMFMQAQVEDLDTYDELSAYGADSQSGVILVQVPENSPLARSGLQSGDVILKVNDKVVAKIKNLNQLMQAKGSYKVVILRAQAETTLTVNL